MLILLSGVLGVAGQLLLKYGVAAAGPLELRPDAAAGTLLAIVLNPPIVIGLGTYASGTFFWLVALSRVDLSYAYPFASLNYLLVLLASWWLLGEQPSPLRLAGVAVICAGVWAISRTPANTTDGVTTGAPAAAGAKRGRPAAVVTPVPAAVPAVVPAVAPAVPPTPVFPVGAAR